MTKIEIHNLHHIYSLLSIVILVSVALCITSVCDVIAEPAIFGRFENIDSEYESNVDRARYVLNNSAILDNLPVDILSTTYSSDGKTLNGTIWVSNPIYDRMHNEYVQRNLTFTMWIYSEDDMNTHNITVYPNSDGTWTKVVKEYEPDVLYWEDLPTEQQVPELTYRIVNSVYNYTSFYMNGQRYVDISVNMDTIRMQDTYWVGFGVDAINRNGTALSDYVLLEHAPPKQKIIDYSLPKEIVKVKAGDQEIRTMSINTTDLNTEETYTFTDANKEDNIMINFEPESVTLPLTGVVNTKLIVKAEGDAYKGNPTLTNQSVTVSSSTEGGEPSDWNETFDIEILPPLSPLENISNILTNNYATYLIPLAVTSVFAIWLFKRIDKSKSDFGWIKVKDILTVDASVIAGVLVFLTIGASEVFSGNAIQQVGILTASIVFPFAIAAIRTLISGHIEKQGIKFMTMGFAYLMISVILVAFIQR
jgi:hypothetical protein